jgi:hypothetical protein
VRRAEILNGSRILLGFYQKQTTLLCWRFLKVLGKETQSSFCICLIQCSDEDCEFIHEHNRQCFYEKAIQRNGIYF